MPTSPPAPDPVARRRPSPGGFSLPELLIACTVVGIAAAAVMPRLDTGRWKADAAQRQLRGALQQAQRLAVQNQFDVVVSFDTANARVRIAEDSTNDGRIASGERRRWIALEEGARFDAPAAPAPDMPAGGAVVGTTLDEVDGFPSVTFHRSGSASSELGAYLRVQYKGRDDRRALTVVQSTGRTDAFRWLDGRWEDARP